MSERPGKTVLLLGSFAPSLLHFRANFIADMVEHGHRVIAAVPDITNEIAAAIHRLGAEPREVSLVNTSLNPFGMIRAYRRLRRLIREFRPDVSIAYTIQPVILAAFAARAERVPTIVSMVTGVGYAFTGGRELKRLIARAAAWPLCRLALARSDAVVFQNRDDEALFRELGLVGPGKRTDIINGSGIDLAQFAPVPLPPTPSFLMIARLLRDKGIREFAEASRRIKAEHPDVPIALVGYLYPSPDALTRDELDALIRCGVEFKGRLDDVRPAIAAASIYVLPSYREGTGQSIVEALGMGRAVVTTDVAGCRETVRDGLNGFLVPARNADALYEAMMRFVRDPSLAAEMGRESRRIAEEKYDVRKVNAILFDVAGL